MLFRVMMQTMDIRKQFELLLWPDFCGLAQPFYMVIVYYLH